MQVTAVYQGSEISYGAGDAHIYAIEECIDGIESMYIDAAADDIELIFTDVGSSTLPKYAKLTDYLYLPRQYF